MSLHFFSEDISFSLTDESSTRNWISLVISNSGYKTKNINYIFCSDEHLLEMNHKYLNHNTFTDIITFDNSEKEAELEADIYISIDRVRENSLSLEVEFDVEIHRVLIHGLLHLFGFSDKTEAEKKEMREKEDACLSLR